MKKKILVLLALCLALTLVFVACKDDPVPDDTTVADQTTEEPAQTGDSTTEPAESETPTDVPSGDVEETTSPEEPTVDSTEENSGDVSTEDTTAGTPDADTTKKPDDTTKEPDTTTEAVTADPMEPVNVFEAADISTVVGGDPSNLTQDCVTLEDGFIHIVPIGPDPYYYPFAGVDGARYVAIRYRTDATGADMQLYIASTGNGPSNDSTMIRQPVIADGEWHVMIFDTQSLIDAGHYDGEYVSYFRFDPLEAGYMLNEDGEPYYIEGTQTFARYNLPENCMIDVAYIGFFHNTEAVEKYEFEAYPPFKQPTDAGQKGASFDTFYVNGQMYFEVDGGAGDKLTAINNTLTFASASELQNIALRGWIGFDQPIDQFGYYVDNYEFIFGDFAQATEDAVLGAGGPNASRFQINVDLSYLEGDDHFVGFIVKLADGTIVQLRAEIIIDLPDLPKDITDSFVSDVNSNEIGTTIDASDLGNFFIPEFPLGGCVVEANGDGKLYHMTSINDFYTDVNGRYFYKANVVDSNGAGWMFVRGYRVVNSDEIIEKFDPAGGFYKINNYYETDMAGSMGGAGIYARVGGGKLFIMIKYYDAANTTRVGNKLYAIDVAGTELTMADDGSTVSIMVDGVTYATIALSGSVDYADINEIDPFGSFAAKAVITLKNGTTETIENTLVAATCESQIGVVSRAGSFKFDAMSVGGYSAIEVPALEVETPVEPEPVDPDAPVLMLNPEFINSQAGSSVSTIAQHIASHEIKTEDGVTFVRLTTNGGDPYVALINLGSYYELPQYMAFAYRTNCGHDGQVFIGSGNGWTGAGDSASIAWNENSGWNLAILDLANCGLTSIQNNLITYCRFDFFTGNGAEGDYMDVEYVAFFNSVEAAEKYFNALHDSTTPDEPDEPVIPDEPEFYENYNVPMDIWTVSGHCPQIVGSTGHANSPMVAAGGIDQGALLHQGSIGLGEIDLSKYSKAVIKFGVDNSEVTLGHHGNNANNRIMLVNADVNMVMSPAADQVIAAADYIPQGWALVEIEIDLTGVDYNGPVYVTYDTLPGTFMLFGSVEFIGAEKSDEPETPDEPEIPDEPVGPVARENVVLDMADLGGIGKMDSFEAAGYYTHVHKLGYGVTVDLGVVDLSKYDYVKIGYGFDAGEGTKANFEALGGNAYIGLKSENSSYGQAGDFNLNGDIIHTTMQFPKSGWGFGAQAAFIDLSEVTYNGNVFVAIHNPLGTEVAISYIEFGYNENLNLPTYNSTYDFSRLAPDNGTSAATAYANRTSPEGWTVNNARIGIKEENHGGALNGVTSLVCLSGKSSDLSVLRSGTISGGIKAIAFNVGFHYDETSPIDLTLTITGENGKVVTDRILVKNPLPDYPHNYVLVLDEAIEGNFTIEIANNCPLGTDANKSRTTIWNFSWESVSEVTPDEPEVPGAIVTPEEAGVKASSFDTFYVNGAMYFPEDGMAGDKLTAINNTIVFDSSDRHESIALRGWIGFSQAIDQFGYYIDGGEIVYGDFKQATEGGVLAAGGEFATRYQVNVPLSDVTTGDHIVGFVVKLADGTVVLLRAELTVSVSEYVAPEPSENTNLFQSNVSAFAPNTPFQDSDLNTGLTCFLPIPAGCAVQDTDGDGISDSYYLSSINEVFGDVNGAYSFTVNFVPTASSGSSMMIVRGYRSVISADYPGPYHINNYYEDDGVGFFAGSGLGVTIANGNLYVCVKAYNPDTEKHVKNEIVSMVAAGSTVTIADNGETIYVLLDGVLCATIELSGETTYEKITSAGVFAQTVTVTMADGTTKTVENTLVASTYTQVALATRGGDFRFTSVKVGTFSEVEIPSVDEEEPETPDEPEVPAEPLTGELNVTTTDNYCWIDVVEFTAPVSGTYTFTLPAGLGAFDVDDCDAWPPVGRPYADYYDNTDGATFSIELAAGETTRFYIGALTKQDWVITWSAVEGDVEGGETPDTPDEPVAGTTTVVLGNNNIVVTDAMFADGGFEATITVDVDGDYKFSSNYLLVRIYNPMGMQLGTGSAYLTAGTYTLQIVTAFAPGAGTYGLEVELLAPVEPDEPDEPETPDDAVEFPYTLTVDGDHDIYFTFAPAEDCVVKITYTLGNYVSGLSDYDRNTTEYYYIARFTGGEVYEINPWGSSAGTYTFEYYVEEVVEDYNVPQSAWTVSGHKPGITPANDATHGGMVGAGGLESGALLHQGSVGIGEIDLSKYSKIIVYCGCDASAVTQGHYNASENNRIILTTADTNMTSSPDASIIIASTTYTLHGWTPEAVEIDLTGINYNGPVFVSYDTLPGTFMLIGAIELIA